MISINLGGGVLTTLLTLLIFLGSAALGLQEGFRRMVGPALAATIGYLLLVRSGSFIVDSVNRIYSGAPQLGAFIIGRDPDSVAPLDPLITGTPTTPLFFRVLLFAGIVALGFGYAWPWRSGRPKPTMQTARTLGALLGLYVASLLTTSITLFAREAGGAVPGALSGALAGLPDLSALLPSMIAAFLIILILVIILRFPQIWKP